MIYGVVGYRCWEGALAGFLDQILAEIQALERELEADPRSIKLRGLRDLQRLYEGDSVSAVLRPNRPDIAAPQGKRGVRESSPGTKHIVSMAGTVLGTRGAPMPTRDLYKILVEEHGCQIGGQDPVNNLSAILSRHGFISHGRAGWTPPQMLDANDSTETDEETATRETEGRLLAPKPNGLAHEVLNA